MKTLKSKLLLLLFLFPLVALAANFEEQTTTVNFVTLLLDYAKFVFVGMFITAANHVIAGTFDIKLWLKDTLLPGVLTYVGGLAVAALDIYATSWDFFVEAALGSETDYTDFSNLAITGLVLVSFVKGLFKRKQTIEKVKLAKK